MIRATIDTNVLASAVLGNPSTPPGAIRDAWQHDAFISVLSALILRELNTTLAKPYFRARLDDGARDAAIDGIRAAAVLVEPSADVLVAELSAADNAVLATAVGGGASYLVTGDSALLALKSFKGVRIVTAAAFVAILHAERTAPDG